MTSTTNQTDEDDQLSSILMELATAAATSPATGFDILRRDRHALASCIGCLNAIDIAIASRVSKDFASALRDQVTWMHTVLNLKPTHLSKFPSILRPLLRRLKFESPIVSFVSQLGGDLLKADCLAEYIHLEELWIDSAGPAQNLYGLCTPATVAPNIARPLRRLHITGGAADESGDWLLHPRLSQLHELRVGAVVNWMNGPFLSNVIQTSSWSISLHTLSFIFGMNQPGSESVWNPLWRSVALLTSLRTLQIQSWYDALQPAIPEGALPHSITSLQWGAEESSMSLPLGTLEQIKSLPKLNELSLSITPSPRDGTFWPGYKDTEYSAFQFFLLETSAHKLRLRIHVRLNEPECPLILDRVHKESNWRIVNLSVNIRLLDAGCTISSIELERLHASKTFPLPSVLPPRFALVYHHDMLAYVHTLHLVLKLDDTVPSDPKRSEETAWLQEVFLAVLTLSPTLQHFTLQFDSPKGIPTGQLLVEDKLWNSLADLVQLRSCRLIADPGLQQLRISYENMERLKNLSHLRSLSITGASFNVVLHGDWESIELLSQLPVRTLNLQFIELSTDELFTLMTSSRSLQFLRLGLPKRHERLFDHYVKYLTDNDVRQKVERVDFTLTCDVKRGGHKLEWSNQRHNSKLLTAEESYFLPAYTVPMMTNGASNPFAVGANPFLPSTASAAPPSWLPAAPTASVSPPNFFTLTFPPTASSASEPAATAAVGDNSAGSSAPVFTFGAPSTLEKPLFRVSTLPLSRDDVPVNAAAAVARQRARAPGMRR